MCTQTVDHDRHDPDRDLGADAGATVAIREAFDVWWPIATILAREFGSVEAVREAPTDDLLAIENVGPSTVAAVADRESDAAIRDEF